MSDTSYPFNQLEPIIFSGLLDDPVLLIRMKSLGRTVMVDCGRIGHLAKRVLKSVDALFITHAHMDHFMGIDEFIRSSLVTSRDIPIFGPPGIGEKLWHKLQAYEWNLVEDFYCTFQVHEIYPEHIQRWSLPGSKGFPLLEGERLEREGPLVFENKAMTVESTACDHLIPSLVYKFTEKPPFLIDDERLTQAGYKRGPWLGELQRRHASYELGRNPLPVLKQAGDGVQEFTVTDDQKLFEEIRLRTPPAAIGYITDVGATPENLDKLEELLTGVTFLVCECNYLKEGRETARRSYHLCTEDLNEIARRVRPRFLLPVHLSNTYQSRCPELYEELSPGDGCRLLRLPDRIAARPLTTEEVPVFNGNFFKS